MQAEQLIRWVCLKYAVSPKSLKSKKRTAAIVKARKVISYGLRLAGYSVRTYAEFVGYSEHSSIVRNFNEAEWNLTAAELEAVRKFVEMPHDVEEISPDLLEFLGKHMKNQNQISKLAYELQRTYELTPRNTSDLRT